MKINKILLVLVIIQVTVIVLGGYLYSLIPIYRIDNISDIGQNGTIGNSTIGIYTKPSLSDSVFFVITIITTIGYGQLTPNTNLGKIFTIIVAFIGIPINIVFLAKIGELLKKGSAYLLKPFQKISKNKQLFIIFQLIFSIISGTIIFLLLPGVFIMKLESWSYIDALYYTFVTLFTIGFGDFVAGSNLKLSPLWMNVYRFSLYLWMYLGMAYISLIITLVLDYFKANAQNLRKEVINIIEEKINLSLRRYLANKKKQFKSRNKLTKEEKVNKQIVKEGLKIKINYSQDKLEELARRRSKCKSHVNLKAYFNQNYQAPTSSDNKAFELEPDDKITENKFYNLDSMERIDEEEIDDECLKIDIEKVNYSDANDTFSNTFTNDYYDTITSDDFVLQNLNTVSTMASDDHENIEIIFNKNNIRQQDTNLETKVSFY
ncbi:unnamed protein product [Brachionus calyciflorus]|uniref:Potassium channel domain-containing protein n=1 Tax=Brachionus calyciflorus TaxID=104777 RepID=A0A814BBJ8_9BILA|nr:unnamed protein product [Brachionus calyciflorus]